MTRPLVTQLPPCRMPWWKQRWPNIGNKPSTPCKLAREPTTFKKQLSNGFTTTLCPVTLSHRLPSGKRNENIFLKFHLSLPLSCLLQVSTVDWFATLHEDGGETARRRFQVAVQLSREAHCDWAEDEVGRGGKPRLERHLWRLLVRYGHYFIFSYHFKCGVEM